MDLNIEIPGQPFTQKRHRSTKKGHRWDPSAGDKKTIRKVLMFYKPPRPLDGPLVVDIDAYFQTPKSWSKAKQEKHEGRYRPKKPDKDNIEKIYFDAMNGFIFDDDKQIVSGRTRKYYSMKPRTVIRIKELELIHK